MQRTLAAGATIAYDDSGPDDAPTVVLLHGLSSNRATYGDVVAHLHEAHGSALRVVNVDLRGHGDSSHHPVEDYAAAGFASDVAALVRELGAGPALVVGHSLGGVVAALMAVDHPELVHSIFLEDPPLFEGDDARRASSPVASFFPKLVAAVRDLQGADAPIDAYEQLVATFAPPDEVAAHARSLQRWDPSTMQAAIDGIVWRGFDPLARIECPITVLRADPAMDAVFEPRDADALLAVNPHARIHLVPGAGHGIHAAPTLPAYLAHLDEAVSTLR